MSFCIANLSPEYRYVHNFMLLHLLNPCSSYHTANLLLAGIMPGPREQDYDQVQRYLRILVNDLLQLWKEGIVLPTPTCSEGHRIRVILLGIICDTPAAHKLGGFGAHSHTKFCIRCWITQEQKADPQAFRRNGLLLTIFICAVQCEYVLGGSLYAQINNIEIWLTNIVSSEPNKLEKISLPLTLLVGQSSHDCPILTCVG